MRYCYLVCYDIADPKRLRRVFRKMHGFGDPVQYSVFRCDLNRVEKALMLAVLEELVNTAHDRVMIVRLGPVGASDRGAIEFLGQPLLPWKRPGAIIV